MAVDGMKCRDMLYILFDLTRLDLDIYQHLLRHEKRAADIAPAMDKDRSTVHRSLQRLVDGGLCTRERQVIDGGGRYFIYRARPPEQVKKHVHACIEGWYRRMHASLEHFTEEFGVSDS